MPPPLSPRDLVHLSPASSHGSGGVRRGPSQRQMLEMAFEGETHAQPEHDYGDSGVALSSQSNGSRHGYEGDYYPHSLYGSTRSAENSWNELSTVLVPTTPSRGTLHDVAAGPHFDDDTAMVEHNYPELFREGVLEHARRLGIDPLTEPELMWIARDSLVAQLPPGWTVQNASSTNLPYYYHTESGVSQWDHPLDEQFRLLVEDYRQRNSFGGGSDNLSSSDGLHTASYYEQHRGYGDTAGATAAWEEQYDATGGGGQLSYGSSTDYPLDYAWRHDGPTAELYQDYELPLSATGSSSKDDEHSDLDIAETQSTVIASGREHYASGSGAISPSHAFELEVLKSQVEELERKNKENEDEQSLSHDRMRDEIDVLKTRLHELEAINKELEDQRSQDDALIERLEHQMKILTDEAPQQQADMDMQRTLLDEKNKLETAVTNLRAALDATNAELEQLRSKMGSVPPDSQVDKADEEHLRVALEIESLRREKAEEASERVKLEELVASQREHAVKMAEDLEQLRRNNASAQRDLESLQRTGGVYEEENLRLVREVEDLRLQKEQEASLRMKLGDEVVAHRELGDKLANDLDEAHAVIKKLEADLLRCAKIEEDGDKNAAAANNAAAAAEQQIQTLNAKLEELRNDLRASEAVSTSLRKEIESLNLEHTRALEANNTEHRLRLAARDAELAIELKAAKDALHAVNDEKLALENQLKQQTQHAAMLKAESEDQQRTLKRDIRVLERDLKALQTVSKEREDEFTAAKHVIADLEQKLREQDAIVEAVKRSAYEEAEKAANEVVRQIQAEKARVALLYSQELQTRRKLHNRVMELQGNIRVFCRVRPIQAVELKSEQSSPAVYFRDNDAESLDLVVGGELSSDGKLSNGAGQKHAFEFDHVFQPDSSQEQVFEQTKALVTSALDGFNVCIFAYGQTGSGKTHTMEGTDADPGIYYRSLKELFKIREERTTVGDFECSMKLSMLEVYNESIVDLLDTASPPGGVDQRKGLEIRIGKQGVYVENLIDVDVFNEKDVTDLMKLGKSHRSVGAHDFNEHSSRSHLVLTITIETFQKASNKRRLSKLHLIDLAGSERVSKTAASGQRLKEAQNINRSLSALGDVIAALGTTSKHVPYRNSKLTFLLQECLSGNSKVLMFVNVSPVQWNAPETLCSLNFASRCRNVALGMAKASNSSGPTDMSSATPSSLKEPPMRSVNSTNSALSTKQRPAAPSPSVKGAQRVVFG